VIVDALATARITRLIVGDMITAPARDAIIREVYAMRGDRDARDGTDLDWTARAHDDGLDAPKLAQWISCPWCASFAAACVVVAARRYAPRAWAPLGTALAFSQMAGLARAFESVL
jgi:hypothetical protein